MPWILELLCEDEEVLGWIWMVWKDIHIMRIRNDKDSESDTAMMRRMKESFGVQLDSKMLR